MKCPRCAKEIGDSKTCNNCGFVFEDQENIVNEVISDVNNDREKQMRESGKTHENVFYIALIVALIVMIVIIVKAFSNGNPFIAVVAIIATPFVSVFAGKKAESIYTR